MGQLTWWAAGGWSMVHHAEVDVGLVSDIVCLPLCLPCHQHCLALPFDHSGPLAC